MDGRLVDALVGLARAGTKVLEKGVELKYNDPQNRGRLTGIAVKEERR